MAEYIKREETLRKSVLIDGRRVVAYVDLLEIPADDVEQVRHARWVSRYAKHWKGKDECGECGYHEKDHRDLTHFRYCPNCGAKMDAEVSE